MYLFSEIGEGREKESKRNIIGSLSHALNWGPGPPSGVCPDRESNQRPFSLWDNAQPTEPHQSGLLIMFLIKEYLFSGNNDDICHLVSACFCQALLQAFA